MTTQRWRPIFVCALALIALWCIALGAYALLKNSQVTAEKVQAYVRSVDLAGLKGEAREKAIRELAAKLNALSLEERRKARFEQAGMAWFEAMTEEEKTYFIEATMPTGFKQMIASFEQLPEENRKRTVDQALRRLREVQASLAGNEAGAPATNAPAISPELEAKIRTIGLQAFYSQSSAQTKAELAPLLEELQRAMQNGRAFHQHR
jgi:hypothetical protein